MGKTIEAGDLPESEKVYLKKDLLGWRTVEPWRDPYTKKINWFNFITGGKRSLFITISFLLLALLFFLAFQEQLINFKLIMENPCRFCVITNGL